MIATGSSLLIDPARYAQAIGVLDRERLTPRDERRFEWLNRLVWATLLLSALWVVIALVARSAQIFVLVPATICCLSVLPLLCLNWPTVKRLYLASRRERALDLTRPLTTIALLEPGARLRNVRNRVLIAVGIPFIYLGVVGISVWEQANFYGRLGALSFLPLGLACVLIYPVERARQRLRAVDLLRQALTKDGPIEEVYYDGIVSLERLQLVLEREEIAQSSAAASPPVIRMADGFREQLHSLARTEAAAVNASIRELSRPASEGQMDAQQREFSCGNFALTYHYDPARNEIVLMALHRRDEARNV
jgi:hypothetical protein